MASDVEQSAAVRNRFMSKAQHGLSVSLSKLPLSQTEKQSIGLTRKAALQRARTAQSHMELGAPRASPSRAKPVCMKCGKGFAELSDSPGRAVSAADGGAAHAMVVYKSAGCFHAKCLELMCEATESSQSHVRPEAHEARTLPIAERLAAGEEQIDEMLDFWTNLNY